jgi:plastocyanin
VTSTGTPQFTPRALQAPTGAVRIEFANATGSDHNLSLRSPSGAQLAVTADIRSGSQVLSVDLPAGVSTFVCTLHDWMTGTITAADGAAPPPPSDGGAGPAPTGVLDLQVTGQGPFAMSPAALTAPAGLVTVALQGNGAGKHRLVVRDAGRRIRHESPQEIDPQKGVGVSAVAADLTPGEWVVECKNHASGGMKVTLTVR